MDYAKYEDAKIVGIDRRRWRVEIVLEMKDGSREVLVATADSAYTSGDQIWFGTKEEYEEVET